MKDEYTELSQKTADSESSADGPAQVTRLLAALPAGEFVGKPPEVDRFMVRVWPDGTVYFKGSRERIDEFLRACAAQGVQLNIDHISLCG
jgi:hypothetical protein